MVSRRTLLMGAAGGLVAAGGIGGLPRRLWADEAVPLSPGVPEGLRGVATLEALPGKLPLIKLTYRPPNYETPVRYFDSVLTPNDAFFVRYHLADIPEVDGAGWRLRIGGDAVETPAEYSLDDLKHGFETVEVVAVCQCSGNRRGLSQPHVAGAEWGYGAMGNARWTGVRLKDVLNKAGLRKEALEVVFDGADGPVIDKTPDFQKSLPIWKALDENTLIAFAMNGAPLPHWNGYPARLVVSGWTGTYWMKHLTAVQAVSSAFKQFWMNPAYRIPVGKYPVIDRFFSQETATSTPITEMVVNSLVTNLSPGHKAKAGRPLDVKGQAWDGGYGISEVLVSTDGGKDWRPATLGEDLGRFSFRPWSFRFVPQAGEHVIMAKATNRVGASQTFALNFNPAGYHNNVVQRIAITAA
ncbi:MAG: molybdopterin-dependent oxidoreductase [Azospirillum sp.]|nr:molybdopterin-dependent oxidoreductase [Azospirillum sp.]